MEQRPANATNIIASIVLRSATGQTLTALAYNSSNLVVSIRNEDDATYTRYGDGYTALATATAGAYTTEGFVLVGNNTGSTPTAEIGIPASFVSPGESVEVKVHYNGELIGALKISFNMPAVDSDGQIVVSVVNRGTAQAGAASTITLAAGAASTNLYTGCFVRIVSGVGVGQVRLITDYVGATRIASVEPVWNTQPDNTSVYEVIPFARVDVGQWLTETPNALDSGSVPASLGGDGPWLLTVNVIDSATDDPINVAMVKVTGNGERWPRQNTLDGTARFNTETADYTISVQADGYTSSVQTEFVGGDLVVDVELDPIEIPDPPAAQQCTVTIYAYDGHGAIEEDVDVFVRLLDPGTDSTVVAGAHNAGEMTYQSNGSGLVTMTLRKSSNYEIRRDRGSWVAFETTDSDIQTINLEILGYANEI